MASKIFVRERSLVGPGAGKPRYLIVAALGTDLRVYAHHIRKAELEKLAEEAGAEIVYLPRGKNTGEEDEIDEHGGQGHGRGQGGGGGRGRRQGGRGAMNQD